MEIEKRAIQIPDKIPVFPLPNVILFPEVELPLYVFEPRYRKMLADSLAGHKFIAIALLKRGWEGCPEPLPAHDVVGAGFIRAVFENPDGTSHILLKGVGRAKIVRYLRYQPYRIARIRELPDKIEDGKELSKLSDRLKKILVQKLRLTSEEPHSRLRFPREFKNPITLTHLASFFSGASPYLKQDLLETTSCNCRTRHLIDILKEEIHPEGSQN